MSKMRNAITVSDMSVVFRPRNTLFNIGKPVAVKALTGITFSIEQGKTLGIVGESGSGKTTLARAIPGLIELSNGRIQFPTGVDPQKDIQFVFQDPLAALDPRMTVEQLITEPLDYLANRPDKPSRMEKLRDIMQQVGLDFSQRHRYAHEFSGGQCQRIGIARAMITEPKILICDEPVSALDVSVRAQIVNLLKDFQQRLGLSLIFIAHDLSLVRFISDQLLVLYQGKLMETGATTTIFSHPGHPYTMDLISAEPRPDPRIEARRTQVKYGDASLFQYEEKGCVYAPRCSHAQERCRREEPGMMTIAESHNVSCFFSLEHQSSV